MADWKPKQFAHKKKKQTGKKTKPFVPADPITPQQAGQDAFRKNILGKFAFGTDILSPLGLDTQGPPQNLPERGISKETYESYGGDPSKGDDSWVAPAPNFLGQPNPVADLMPYSKEGLSAWWNETSDAIMHLGKAAKNLLDLGSQNTVQFAEQLTQGSINPAKFVFDRFNDLLTVTSAPFIVLDQVARVEPRLKTVSNVIRGVFEATSWLERSKFKAINRLADESGLTKFLADNGGLSIEKQQALRQSVDEFLAGAMPIVIGVGGAKIPWAKAFGKKPPPIEPTVFKEGIVPKAGDILTPPDDIGTPPGLPPGPPAPPSLPAPGETTGRIALPPSSLPQPPSGSELGKRVARGLETNKLELRLREDLLKTEREIQDPVTPPKERVKLTKLAAEIRQQLKNLDDTGDPTKPLEETKPKTRKKSQAPKKIVTEKTDTEPGSITVESSLPPNPKAPKNQGVKLRSEEPKETTVSKNNKENALKVPDEEGKIPVEEKKVLAPEKLQNELDLPQENIEFIQNKVKELYDKGGIDEVNKVYDESSPVGRYGREYAKRYAEEKTPSSEITDAERTANYEAAKQRLAEKTKGRLNALPLDTIPELLEIGAYWIHKGAKTFGEWAMRVTKEIGATSGKLLRQAWDELTKDRTNLENIIANGVYISKKAKRDTKNVTPFKISGDKHDIMKHPKIGETFDKIKKRGGTVYDAFGGSGRIAQELHQRGMSTVVNFLPFKKNLIDKFGSKPFVKSVKQLTELLEAEKDPRNQVKILREYPDKDAATLVANNVNKYRKEIETPDGLTAFDMDVTASKLEQVRTIASKPYPIESTAKDGWDVLREAKPGDAVILDPPYTGIKNDYARNGGLTPEHLQAIKEAVDRGVNIVYFDKFSPVLAKQLRKIGLSTNAIQRVASKFRELFAYKIAPYIKGEKSLKEPGTLGIFGGNLGKSFKAKERQGVLIDHPTEPGKKVYEIDDSNMKFKKRGEEFIQRFVHDVNKKSTPSKLTNMKLGDFVDWPELFQEYPHAKNIKTEWTHYPEGKESLSGGLYNYKTKTIELYSTEGEVGLRDALKNRIIHEVQHELSGKEGWDAGGSTPRVLWHMENFIQREKSLIDSLTHNNPEKRFKQYQLAAKRFLNKFNPPGAVLNDGLVKALFAKSEPDILVLYPLADNAYNGLRGEKLSRIAESRRELTASEREQLPPSENKHASYPDSGETLQRYMNADITGKISIPNAVNESRAPGPPPPPPRPVKAKREFPKPESGFNTWQRLVFETVNFWEPLSRRARETGVRDKVGDPSLEMAMLNNRNYFAGNWIKGKVGLSLQADGLNFKAHSNTIRNYLRLVRGKEQEFADYLMARRIVGDHEYLALSKKNLLDATKEYHRKNVDFATTPKGDPNYARIKREYDDAVKQLKHWKEEVAETQRLIERDNFDLKEAKAKELAGRNAFAKPTAMYDKINERMLEWSHYSGRLPKELFDEWKANKNYASFKRWIEHHQIVTSTDLKRNPSQKDFSAREGSTRGLEVIDPVFSQAQMITETISKSLENMMWNRLDTLADSNAALRTVFYPDPDGPIVFMKNGKKVRYAAPLDIIEMAKTMSPGKIGEAAEFALWAARTFVRGTTSANPFWGMSVNFVIDQLSAMMNSKYGFVPIWTPLRHALPNMIKNRTLWQIFKAMGGEKSTLKGMLGDDPATFGNEVLKEAFTPTDWSSAREIFRKDYWKGDKPSDVGRKAVELSLNALELPTNITEMMTRFAEFKKAIDEGASHTEAMYHAMNVSVPFHMRGRLGGAYSLLRTIAYLGANIQAFYRYAKTTRDAPYKITAITAGSILATMGAMHHFQNASDQQKRMLGNKTIEDLTKAIFLPHPDGKTLIRIRIPDVLGAFTAFPALWAIGNMLGGKKAETREYAKALMQLLPIPFQWYDPTKGFTLKPALNMLPQVIKPTLEVATNTRSYPEVMPIVPEYLQDVKPQYQYTDYTSDFAKFMGELTGSSPMLIDHWVRAQFGSMAGYILKPQNLASSNSLWQDEGVWAISGRTYNGFYEIKDMALKDYKESRDSKKKSFEENRQVVARNVITERVGKIVSDLRKIQRANPDALTEPMKEQAYELMVNINNDPNLENRLLEVESLSKNVMKVIKELELTPSHTPFYANEYPLYVKNKLEKLHPEREKEIEQFTKKAKEIRKTREKEKKQTTKEEQEEQDDD